MTEVYTQAELVDMRNSEDEDTRVIVAGLGKHLRVLSQDKSVKVRRAVAEQGAFHEVLAKDPSEVVRRAVAKMGYRPHLFVGDSSPLIRREVARAGLYLEILAQDESEKVRLEVAYQGYHCPEFLTDPYPLVRMEMAEQGYGAEVLCHDKVKEIRHEIAEQGLCLDVLVDDEDFGIALLAQDMLNANVVVIARKFGTYRGALYLTLWNDYYTIRSGCHTATSLEEWKEQAETRVGKVITEVTAKMIQKHLTACYGVS